jgi:hypothetical protein
MYCKPLQKWNVIYFPQLERAQEPQQMSVFFRHLDGTRWQPTDIEPLSTGTPQEREIYVAKDCPDRPTQGQLPVSRTIRKHLTRLDDRVISG